MEIEEGTEGINSDGKNKVKKRNWAPKSERISYSGISKAY